ncbi:hypothetical protein PoB_005511300 [Plakobranchus ocellatus]|uniref:Uncharacterized protein n=1 Tax=Plakobranchus ocellatus TaxID=259542 RepID=A0AAV4CAS9_9GAST|nr:hypothetical protein PoB_005511300 [Plakobranchus ocellatus]
MNVLFTKMLHPPLCSALLKVSLNSRPVHSLILPRHLFLCTPRLLPPWTVPCMMQGIFLYDHNKWTGTLLTVEFFIRLISDNLTYSGGLLWCVVNSSKMSRAIREPEFKAPVSVMRPKAILIELVVAANRLFKS